MSTDYMLRGSFGRTRYWVNGYMLERPYGGPEEGGWWYDAGTPTGESFGPFTTLEGAREFRDRVEERHADRNADRWPLHSSLATDLWALLVEEGAPKAFPECTPQYC